MFLNQILGHFFWLIFLFIGGLFVAFFFMVGASFLGIATGQQKNHFRFLSQYIEKRGYRFLNGELGEWIRTLSLKEFALKLNSPTLKTGAEGLHSVREFERMRRDGIDAFVVKLHEKDTSIFSGQYRSKQTSAHAGTGGPVFLKIAKMNCDLELSFRLENKNAVAVVEKAVNQILKFAQKPGTTDYLNLRQSPSFSKHYYLMGSDEEKIQRFFSPEKTSLLESAPMTATVFSEPPYLVYFELGRFTDEKSYDDFIARAGQSFEKILA